MITQKTDLEQGRTALRQKSYAMLHEGKPKHEDTLTGGFVMLWGEKRFVPIGVRKAKPRHCCSCAMFHEINPCGIGLYVHSKTDACEKFKDRNWRIRG